MTCSVKIDMAKIDRIMETEGLTKGEFAISIGHTSSWYRHALDQGGMITPTDYIAIKGLYGVDVKLIEPKKKEEIKESSAVTDDSASKIEEVTLLLKDILTAINRVGNVEMQMLEELHKFNQRLERPKAYIGGKE